MKLSELLAQYLHSPWSAAGAWVAFVLAGSAVVEAFCVITNRPKLSNVMWWLIANFPIPMIVAACVLGTHFFWQKASVYTEYRCQKGVDRKGR